MSAVSLITVGVSLGWQRLPKFIASFLTYRHINISMHKHDLLQNLWIRVPDTVVLSMIEALGFVFVI